MTALVTATGTHTFFVRAAGLVQAAAGSKSPFAKANNHIGVFLIPGVEEARRTFDWVSWVLALAGGVQASSFQKPLDIFAG